MTFPEDVVAQAWKRSGGKCECKRWKHNHNYTRCNAQLVPAIRGQEGQGRWEAHRINLKVMTRFQTVRFYVGIAISEAFTSNNTQGQCPLSRRWP
jgi:hypothetical protein